MPKRISLKKQLNENQHMKNIAKFAIIKYYE